MSRQGTVPWPRGQALLETALVVPLLLFLMLGAADLGRAFYFNLEISGASRAGLRTGVQIAVTDIGQVLRSEPNNSIPNDATTWGQTGAGGTYSNCTSDPATQKCGDPTGCPPASFQPGQVACFAVRPCTITNNSCGSFGPWGVRPDSGSDLGLDVRVVYKFIPVTPLVANLAGSAGLLYLTVDTYGLELY